MPDPFKVAAIQLNSGENKKENLAIAEEMIHEAAHRGAQLIILPEMFNCLGHFQVMIDQAESIPGPTSTLIAKTAKELQVTILAGSITEKDHNSEKAFNTSLLFGTSGDLLATYRKFHLFDVEIPDRVSIQESDYYQPGDQTVVTKTELGQLGLSICYDLRFAELYRQMATDRVELILVPSAFTQTTGKDHWIVLLRARAIENQSYVIAANQCGKHTENLTSYGHSAIIDPWGKVLAEAGSGLEMIVAEIDLSYLQSIREQLPALKHRRF